MLSHVSHIITIKTPDPAPYLIVKERGCVVLLVALLLSFKLALLPSQLSRLGDSLRSFCV